MEGRLRSTAMACHRSDGGAVELPHRDDREEHERDELLNTVSPDVERAVARYVGAWWVEKE
ncbi:hypothetical protein [Halobaculum limi]|uniref:hypothetical protein n=1 Tax=Halobaculum limi TaxID=3031916 RepID=UPI0024066F4F|nr:hypothetical protein [Halobaculum sp. YSMS11]